MGGAGRPAGGPSHLHWTVSPFHDLLPTQQDTAGCLIAKCPRFLDKDSVAEQSLLVRPRANHVGGGSVEVADSPSSPPILDK